MPSIIDNSDTRPVEWPAISSEDERSGIIAPHVSMVVPMYNEEDNVAPMLNEMMAVGTLLGVPYEIIFVDDGSTDKTVANLKGLLGSVAPCVVTVVQLARNYGQTAAMAAGIAQAKGQVMVTLDGDLQNDPRDIPKLIEQLDTLDADMVVGWRQNRQDAAISRKLPSWIANRLIGWMTGIKFKDYGRSLKVYRADLAKSLKLYGELHRFIPVLASMEGARIEQVPVSHRARQFGKSKYGISRTFKVILDLGMLLFLQRFFTRPLHMFGRLGLLFMTSGFGLLSYLAIDKLVAHHNIGDRPLLMLGMLLLLAGLQLLSTGLVAELQIRTYFESQQKKPYNIRRLIQS